MAHRILDAAMTQTLMREFFPGTLPTKSQRRQLQIIEAAIVLLAEQGLDGAGFDAIAEKCGVSRSLIQHYFASHEELLYGAARYIRAQFQDLAVTALTGASGINRQLAAYVRASIEWPDRQPRHSRVWLLFFFFAGFRARFRKLNSELVAMGHRRIEAMLAQGEREGVFCMKDRRRVAKEIQLLITGAVMSRMTEDSEFTASWLGETTVRRALQFAGFTK